MKNGDLGSANIYVSLELLPQIESYINDENKVAAYDIVYTMCDQLKG